MSSTSMPERRGQPTPQLERLASLTTSSLPALKLFLDGEALAHTGQYTDAAIVFVWAAEVAPSEADETATLSDAFVCLVLAGQWEDEA